MSQLEYSHVVRLAIPRPLVGLFTYGVPASMLDSIKLGCFVQVPFGKSKPFGFVIEEPIPLELARSKPDFMGVDESKIRLIEKVGPVVCHPITLELCAFGNRYFRGSLGEMIQSAVPPAILTRALEDGNVVEEDPEPHAQLQRERPFELNSEQIAACELIRSSGPKENVTLLHGVTGSGKTEVYFEMARETLNQGKSVLFLVPEIALTPQLCGRFEEALGSRAALWHSAVSDGRRRKDFWNMFNGVTRACIGARSAVFAPLKNLGLIVVDEEHDPSFKQEDRVRYHARDLAVVRGKLEKAHVILGSATPSLETRERVREGKYQEAKITSRAVGNLTPNQIEIVDLSVEPLVEGIQSQFAVKTLETIRETLSRGEQVMVYLNRRGFASFLICGACGDVKGCPDCSISLTYHKRSLELRCHVCGHREKVEDQCPKCSSADLLPMGAGTESLEEDLPRLIPEMKPIRLDRDIITSTKRLEKALSDFASGEANTLLGTQMLVKGHDFPRVTLVVVVLADALFRFPDFRAVERAYQVLTQVAGRAGRSELGGKVMIQTYQPEHQVIQVLTGALSLDKLIEQERELRRELGYPPFGRIGRIRIEDANDQTARERADALAAAIQKLDSKVEVLGPSEAFLEKAKGIFRWDILLKAKSVEELAQVLAASEAWTASQRWSAIVDVDPYGVN